MTTYNKHLEEDIGGYGMINSQNRADMDVIIIGGGVAGLTARDQFWHETKKAAFTMKAAFLFLYF